MSCAFCGRENEAESRFCIDCGKPVNLSAARVGPAYVPRPSGGPPQPYVTPAAATRVSAAGTARHKHAKPRRANAVSAAQSRQPEFTVLRTLRNACHENSRAVWLLAMRILLYEGRRSFLRAVRQSTSASAYRPTLRDRAAPRPLDSRDQARDLASRSSARRMT